jgi:hypothetical protein
MREAERARGRCERGPRCGELYGTAILLNTASDEKGRGTLTGYRRAPGPGRY